MAEMQIQYKCQHHGAQPNGLQIVINATGGEPHRLFYCWICVAEAFGRIGLEAMFPAIEQKQAAVVEDDNPFPKDHDLNV